MPAPVARIVHAALLRDPTLRCPSVGELALALDMAVGIDTSRRRVPRESLRPLPEAARRAAAPRAERASSWDELLRT